MTPAPHRRVSSPPLSAPNRRLKPLEPDEDPQLASNIQSFCPHHRRAWRAPHTTLLNRATTASSCKRRPPPSRQRQAARRVRPSQRRRPCYTIVVVRAATGATSAFALSASARTAVLRIVVVSCVVAAAAGKRRSQATLVQARNACLRCKITTLFANCGSQEVAQNVLKCES